MVQLVTIEDLYIELYFQYAANKRLQVDKWMHSTLDIGRMLDDRTVVGKGTPGTLPYVIQESTFDEEM